MLNLVNELLEDLKMNLKKPINQEEHPLLHFTDDMALFIGGLTPFMLILVWFKQTRFIVFAWTNMIVLYFIIAIYLSFIYREMVNVVMHSPNTKRR